MKYLIKGIKKYDWYGPTYRVFYTVRDIREKGVRIRFEDIKTKPEETLLELCGRLEIDWSDELLKVTTHGEITGFHNGEKEIYDFDLEPVYNLYEECYSELDRFRHMILSAFYQKECDYPYVDPLNFSRKELQELFLKDFRFEEKITFSNERDKIETKVRYQHLARGQLQKARMNFLLYNDN